MGAESRRWRLWRLPFHAVNDGRAPVRIRYYGSAAATSISMAFPIKVCSLCGEKFELKPDKPGFANRCPACSAEDVDDPAGTSTSTDKEDAELSAARRKAMRDLLYRKDS